MSSGPKRGDGEVPQEERRPDPSQSEETEGKALSEHQAWHAKRPPGEKSHLFSFPGHRVAALALHAKFWGDRFVSLCLTMLILLSLARHWFAIWRKTINALKTV